MSIQYRDGSFSENMPIDEAFKEFSSAIANDTARALFVGTEKELDHIKQKKKLEDQVSELSRRLEKLEQPPVTSSNVVIPTRDEMIQVLRGSLTGRHKWIKRCSETHFDQKRRRRIEKMSDQNNDQSECNKASNSTALLSAIKLFEKIKKDHNDWYMKHERVSLAMMCEKDSIDKKCDWAIKCLQNAGA